MDTVCVCVCVCVRACVRACVHNFANISVRLLIVIQFYQNTVEFSCVLYLAVCVCDVEIL